MTAVEVEDRYIQFILDRQDSSIKQALKASISTPFIEMIARNLPGHLGVTVCILVNRQFFPLTACIQLIEDVIEYLIEWYLAHIPTLCFR